MQAAEEAKVAADLLQKAEAALEEVAQAEAATAETGVTMPVRPQVLQHDPLFALSQMMLAQGFSP